MELKMPTTLGCSELQHVESDAKTLATLQAEAALRGLELAPIRMWPGDRGYVLGRRGGGAASIRAFDTLDQVRQHLQRLGQPEPRA